MLRMSPNRASKKILVLEYINYIGGGILVEVCRTVRKKGFSKVL